MSSLARLKVGGALLGALALAAPAQAATVTSAKTTKANCLAPAAKAAKRTVTAPRTGFMWARLQARKGDWDVGVFAKRKRVAGAAGFGGRELASGYVRKGQRLTVQACRRPGASRTARLTLSFTRLLKTRERMQIVRVEAHEGTELDLLRALDLDLTEHGDEHGFDVVLHGRRDEQLLRAAGLEFKVIVPDLQAASRARRRADARAAAEEQPSELPSGRTSYRFLEDYEADMKQLAAERPDLVKPITLPHRSLEGREIHGLEITSNVDDVDDGKPVFVQTGVHHAREWPSSEHAMEWAFELVKGYGKSQRTTDLVDRVRTIIIPVVNVDGFNLSRRAPVDGTSHEYKRKNCRVADGQVPAAGECTAAPANRGVDPNRNYGGLWGGPGASTSLTSETYRGAGPFSEPETQNIRELVSSRQVTALITNHTHGGLVLRPPGVGAYGWAPDEDVLKALGDRMASHNGYTSQYGWQLYDTNGTTEDWSYTATGGLGYTFEIGTGGNFHLEYASHVIGEYLGTSGTGAGKGGNRQAYFAAMEEAANTASHGVLTGRLVPGHVLTLRKAFDTTTAPIIQTDGSVKPAFTFPDTVESRLDVSTPGEFTWHVNPSTRPQVRGGRPASGKPTTPDFALEPGSVPLLPQPVTVNGVPVRLNAQDFPFTVTEDQDNGYLTARIEWAQGADNWDLYFYRRNGDGSLTEIARSRNSASARPFEELQSVHVGPGEYVVRVANQQAVRELTGWSGSVTFSPPEPPEAYTLECHDRDGELLASRQVVVKRGETVTLGDPCK